MECPICCERYTPERRRPVECPFCPQTACTTCVRAFVVSDLVDPRCMGCRAAWSREFLDSHMPRAFMTGEYKRHRERVLEHRELAMLPATQERLPAYREYLGLIARADEDRLAVRDARREVAKLKIEVSAAKDALRAALRAPDDVRAAAAARVDDAVARHAAAEETVVHLNEELWSNETRSRRLEEAGFLVVADAVDAAAVDDEAGPSERRRVGRVFVRACPADGCRGFLSQRWKCGTCGERVCSKCHEIVSEPFESHECDPSIAASAALIAADSKPCPSCASVIHKISGCDQMYCVACNTAFGWRTGEIVTATNRIHNPHYYDWLFRQGRQGPQGQPAPAAENGGCEDRNVFQTWLAHRIGDRVLVEYHRVGRHVHGALGYLRCQERELEDHLDLRLRYLTGAIDSATWRATLQRREKKREKLRAVCEVYDMFVAAGDDIFRSYLHRQNAAGDEAAETAKAALNELLKYADDCLVKISERFNTRIVLLRDVFVHDPVDPHVRDADNLL